MNTHGSDYAMSSATQDELRRSVSKGSVRTLFVAPFSSTIVRLGVSLCLAVSLLTDATSYAGPADESSDLPFTSTAQVVVRKEGSLRTRTLSGVIEDMSGQSIILRRGGNTIDVLKLREVVAVRFYKSPEFDDGLRKLRERNWKAALSALQSAEKDEPRKWVRREIQASIAGAQRALGQFEQCLQTIEKILDDDPDSRHVTELPLVWDERLPPKHRIDPAIDDLQSRSVARRLTAASALLHVPEYQPVAVALLESIRSKSRGTMQELAETQLWRVRLLNPDELRESEINQWARQVRYFNRRTRSGAEFIIGRALLATHDYDNAATSLLWMPLLEPLDPPTTAASLTDAISALELSGRMPEASRLRLELSQWQSP